MIKKSILSIFLSILLVVMIPAQYGKANGNQQNMKAVGMDEYNNVEIEMSDEEYAVWKENYISQFQETNGVASRLSIISGNTLENEYIGISLASNGRFTIGTTGGNPDITTDDNKKLLYGYPGGTTSYTTVRINGRSHIYSALSGSFDEVQNNHVSSNTYDGINVEQSLTIVEGADRDDLVEIKYTVKNSSSTTQNVGLRIMLDTMLGSNDSAPFRVAGYGNVTTETEFNGDDIPFYWQAFDSLTNPQVTAIGQFWSDNGNNPDTVQFTNWRNVYGTDWGYQVKGTSNGDSAVSIIWNEDSLQPNETKEYVTYYGLSELSEDLRPPIALGVYADSNVTFDGTNYSPSEITVSSYIKNISGVTANNVKVSIILPEDLSIVSSYESEKRYQTLGINEEKEQYFKIFIHTKNPKSEYTIQVKIEADDCDPKVVSRTIKIQNTKKAIIVVPGIMGSNLIDSSTNELVWFDNGWSNVKGVLQAVLRKFECNSDGTSVNSNIIPKYGSQEYGALNTYQNLITRLKTKYEPHGYDIVFAAYDWRMSLENGASYLQSVIKDYDEVSIVAHSMGGLVVEKYISTRGTNKIKKVVTAGTPYWGAPMAADTLYSGNIDAFKVANFFTSGIMTGVLYNLTGIYELLPNKYYTEEINWWKQWSDSYDSFWSFILGPSMVSDLYNWSETKDAYYEWFNNNLVTTALNDQGQLNPINSYSPMDKVDCTMIVGNGIATEISSGYFFNYNVNNYSKITAPNMSLQGDGTVPFISATMNRWNSGQYNNIEEMKGFDHTQLVTEDTPINKIIEVLDGALGMNENNNVSQRTLYNTISVESDVTEDEYYSLYLAGNIDFDVYLNDELCYYSHPSGDDLFNVKQDNDFNIKYLGIFNNMPVMMLYFKNADYQIMIQSNEDQHMNLVLDTNEIGYALEAYGMNEKETLKVTLSDGKPVITTGGGKTVEPLVIIDGALVNETTIYFVDETNERWIANDSAVMELVDNTNGHDHYTMTTKDNKIWSVKVPTSAYNVTFNRYNKDKSVLWNSWSAGGRDGKVTYKAEGTSNGKWTEDTYDTGGFKVGDIVLLDLTDFTNWMNNNAVLYANFTNATKKENGGNDIIIEGANPSLYNPVKGLMKVKDNIYLYQITKENEGADTLRFWRGNETTLWNCSVELTYEEYKKGNNCVKVTGWTEYGSINKMEVD